MSLRTWSARRLLVVWVVGLAVQAALIFALTLVARRLVEHDGPRLLREAAAQDERWRGAEIADSLRMVEQRSAARAAGTFTVTTLGDTLFPLVHTPSGRPDTAQVASGVRRTARTARYGGAALLGAVPLGLVAITAAWLVRAAGATGRSPTLERPDAIRAFLREWVADGALVQAFILVTPAGRGETKPRQSRGSAQ